MLCGGSGLTVLDVLAFRTHGVMARACFVFEGAVLLTYHLDD